MCAAKVRAEPGNAVDPDALAVYIGNEQAGYLRKGSCRRVWPGAATVRQGEAAGSWMLECAAKPYSSIEVGNDWKLRAAVVSEVLHT